MANGDRPRKPIHYDMAFCVALSWPMGDKKPAMFALEITTPPKPDSHRCSTPNIPQRTDNFSAESVLAISQSHKMSTQREADDKDISTKLENGKSHAISNALPNASPTASITSTGATILPDALALLVTRLSYVGTLSIRSSALLAEAALEGARLGTITGLEMGRKTLEGLVSSVFDLLVRDSNNFGSARRGAFGSLVEKYSNLGVLIHGILFADMKDISCLSYVFISGVVFHERFRVSPVNPINRFRGGRGECTIH